MLELDGLSRAFGDVVALDDLTFGVQPGQLCGFVGANGAGKTTAMRIVMGVTWADAGEVRWRGEPVDDGARRRFGYMPEERGLYPKMPAARQLAYFGRLRGRDRRSAQDAARSWLARFGLAERADEPVENLSLGNQQRVQLAAAMVHDPEALVLDEPFSGLDPLGTDALSEALAERAADGVPVLFSSHQLELVERLCDAVVIINAGRLVAAGTVEQLREQARRNLWRVEVDTDSPWAEALPGVDVRRRDDRGVLVELADGTDSQSVLDAARRAGRVEMFGAVRPSLAELYREAVTSDGGRGGDAGGEARR